MRFLQAHPELERELVGENGKLTIDPRVTPIGRYLPPLECR